jgi:hypothetical protein
VRPWSRLIILATIANACNYSTKYFFPKHMRILSKVAWGPGLLGIYIKVESATRLTVAALGRGQTGSKKPTNPVTTKQLCEIANLRS